MKILICSVAPIFPTEFHGGSGRVLVDVAVGLGDAGHSVEVLCTRRKDNCANFHLHPNVQVRPVLRFKETYPEPFYVPPYQLAEVVQLARTAADKADVIYIHDGEFPFHFIYAGMPTVIAFQDFVYPDTLSNAMSFERDSLIVASDYVKRCVEDSIGQYRLDISSRIHVIPNGIDLELFQKKEPLYWQSELISQGYYLIGCPHRPDPTKGLRDGVHLVAKLKLRANINKRKPMLLVPRWMDSRINPDDGHVYRTLYDALMEEAKQLGVSQNIYFHDWIGGCDIANYYSGCDVIIAIGPFVEAFGNVPVEAAACGTPSVVVKVGGHVGKLPHCICAEVPPLEPEAAASGILEMLESDFDYDAIREHLLDKYGLSQMIEGYRHVIESAHMGAPLLMRSNSIATHVRLAAWCRFIDGRLYHDYLQTYLSDPLINALFCNKNVSLASTSWAVEKILIDPEKLSKWKKEGYVVENI